MRARHVFAAAVAMLSAAALLAGGAALRDGIYKGSAKGYRGPIEVELTVKGSKIAAVKILKHTEDRPLKALDLIPKRIVEKQSAEVDAVTRATFTSKGIMKAVANALEAAAPEPKKTNSKETGNSK